MRVGEQLPGEFGVIVDGDGRNARPFGKHPADPQRALEIADPLAAQIVEPGRLLSVEVLGAQEEEIVVGEKGFAELEAIPALGKRGRQRQAVDRARLGLRHHLVPRTHLEPDVGAELAVDEFEVVGGETFDLTLRVLDDPGGPILAGAEDDARMRREPRPLRRGQEVRTGRDGFRAGRGKQSDAKQREEWTCKPLNDWWPRAHSHSTCKPARILGFGRFEFRSYPQSYSRFAFRRCRRQESRC